MRQIKIGLLGFGTVGQAVYKLLTENAKNIAERTGFLPVIEKVLVRDLKKKRNLPIDPKLLTTDPEDILEHKEISIVCELMGGIKPAEEYILSALEKGKAVVTANKALLSEKGEKVFSLVNERRLYLGFEASVGGGIPIIKTMKEALVGNKIKRIVGIANGTTNYILTQMLEKGMDFAKALRLAQEKGFAEADPSLDLKGIDSAHKLSLLASLAFNFFIPFDRVYVEGIDKIELIDLEFARKFGYVVKLLAIAKENKGRYEIRVHPALIPEKHILTSVRFNYNAFYIQGDFVGDILLYGLGAGGAPTASAVVSDIIDAIEFLTTGKRGLISYPQYEEEKLEKIRPIEDCEFRYYFRFQALDKPGVLSKISGILGKYGISIASVVQIGRQKGKGAVPIVMLTHETKEGLVSKALSEISKLDVVKGEVKKIRIFEE
jgi:homoserine dehydrogenase